MSRYKPDEQLLSVYDRPLSTRSEDKPYPNYVVGSRYAALQRLNCKRNIGDVEKAFELREDDIVTVINTDPESNSVRIEKKVTLEMGWCPARIGAVATLRATDRVVLILGRSYETLGHISIRDSVSPQSDRIARLTAGCRVRLLAPVEDQMHIEVLSGTMRGVTGWISTTSASGENVVAMLPYFSTEPDTWFGKFCSVNIGDSKRRQTDSEVLDCGWKMACCSDQISRH